MTHEDFYGVPARHHALSHQNRSGLRQPKGCQRAVLSDQRLHHSRRSFSCDALQRTHRHLAPQRFATERDRRKSNDPKVKRTKLLFAGIADGKINGRPIAEDATYSVSTIRFIAKEPKVGSNSPKKSKHKLSIPIGPGGWPLRLRFMIDEHFDKSLLFYTAKLFWANALSKRSIKTEMSRLPSKHRVVMLEDEVAWSFRNENNLNFTSIFIGPINSSTVDNQKDTFNGGFF